MSGRATLYAALGVLIVGLTIYIILSTTEWSGSGADQKEGFAVGKYDLRNITKLLPQIKSDIDTNAYTDILIPSEKAQLYGTLNSFLNVTDPKPTDADALQKAQSIISPYNESSFLVLGADSQEYTRKAEKFRQIQAALPSDVAFFQIAVLPGNSKMYSREKGQYNYYTDFTSEQIATLDSVKLSTDPIYNPIDNYLKVRATNQLNMHNLFYVKKHWYEYNGTPVYTIYNIEGKRIYIEDKTNRLKLTTTKKIGEFMIPITNLDGQTVDDSYIEGNDSTTMYDIPFNILDDNILQFNFGGKGQFQRPSVFHALKLIRVTNQTVTKYFNDSIQALTNVAPSANALIEKYYKIKYLVDALTPNSTCSTYTKGVKKVRISAINLESTFPGPFVKFLRDRGYTMREAVALPRTMEDARVAWLQSPAASEALKQRVYLRGEALVVPQDALNKNRTTIVAEFRATLSKGSIDTETDTALNAFIAAPYEIAMNISQIAVIDVNNINVAKNKTVTISDGAFIDIDNIKNNTTNGELFTKPSTNNKLWKSKNNSVDTSYLEIDLANAFDIAYIIYFGATDAPDSLINKGIKIECMNINGDILDSQITTTSQNKQFIRLCNRTAITITGGGGEQPSFSQNDGFDKYMDAITDTTGATLPPALGDFPGFGPNSITMPGGEFTIIGSVSQSSIKEVSDSLSLSSLLKLSSDNIPSSTQSIDKKSIYRSGGAYTRENTGDSTQLQAAPASPATYNAPPAYEEYLGESMRVALNGLGHFFRGSADKQCYPELEQDIYKGAFIEIENRININLNATSCSRAVDPTTLALLPYATRTFVKQWFYNRDRRLIGYIYRGESAEAIKARQAAVVTMEPQPSINIQQKYILDQIAQQFYEMTNGRYRITYIYDISTVGKSVMDIRFDCAKHAYSLSIEQKMKTLRDDFETRLANPATPLTENGVLEMKQTYYDALDKLQMEQDKNINYEKYTGLMGKFFYEKVEDDKINITGFTLEGGVAHSFEPALNGGLVTYDATQKGGRQIPGNINYDPTTHYTQNKAGQMDFSKPWRQILTMFDYADATTYDLSGVLANAPNDPWDLSGTIKVKKIWGATQVAPFQCMMAWEEDVIDPKTNLPYAGRSGIRRKALITYRKNTADWFSNETIFDASGFRFLRADTIEACIFRPADFRYAAGGALIGKSDAEVTEYFKKYGLRAEMSPCPTVNPGAVFSPLEYAEAYPKVKGQYGSNQLAITDEYRAVGVAAGHTVHPSKTLVIRTVPLLMPVVLPGDSMLDDAGGACGATDCRDPTVLYSLVNQYNRNKDMSGNILKVLNAYTPGPNQCDLEVLVDMIGKSGGVQVAKGAEGVKQQKLSMYVTLDRVKCEYKLEALGSEKDPSTIVKETPTLPAPLDYTEEVRKENVDLIQYAFGNIASVANTTFNRLKDVLSSYRQGTYASIGDLAELDGCPGLRCGDPSVMQSFIRFYESKNWQRTRITRILRAGTVNGRTCDYTYEIQPNGLDVNGRPVSLPITTTVGTRVTLQEDPAVKCRFNVSSFTPLMPSPSWDQLKDITATDLDRSSDFKGRDDINYVNTRPFRYVDCRGAKALNQIAKFDQDVVKINAIKNANMNQCISEIIRNKNTMNYLYTFDIDENIDYKVVDFVEGQILFNRPEAAAPGPGCTSLKEVFLVDGGGLEYEINSSDTSIINRNTIKGESICKQYNAELASYANLKESFDRGANWNDAMFGLAANGSFYKPNYTATTARAETGIKKSADIGLSLSARNGTLCYGEKPKQGGAITTRFNSNYWATGEMDLVTVDELGNKRCYERCGGGYTPSGPNCISSTAASITNLTADNMKVDGSFMSVTSAATGAEIKKTSAFDSGQWGWIFSKGRYVNNISVRFRVGQTNTRVFVGMMDVNRTNYHGSYTDKYIQFNKDGTVEVYAADANKTGPGAYTAVKRGPSTSTTYDTTTEYFIQLSVTTGRVSAGYYKADGTPMSIGGDLGPFSNTYGAEFYFQTDLTAPAGTKFTNVRYATTELIRTENPTAPIICATGTDLYVGTTQNRCYGPCDPGLDDLGFICSAEKVTDPAKLLSLSGSDVRRNTVVTFKRPLPETILPTRDCAGKAMNVCTDASGALIKYRDCSGNVIPCNTCTTNSVVCAIPGIDSVNGTDFYGQKVYESEQINSNTCKVRVLNAADAAKAATYGDIYKYMRFYQEYDCTIKHARFDSIPCTAPLTCPAVGATVGGFTVYASQKLNDTTCEVRVLDDLAAAAANSYSDIYKRLNYLRNLRDCTFNLVSVTPAACTKSVNCFISGLDRAAGADFYGRRVYRSEQVDQNTCRVKVMSDTAIAAAAATTTYGDTTKLLRFRTDPVACVVRLDNEAPERPPEPFTLPTIDKVNGTMVYGRLVYDAVQIGPYSIEARVLSNAAAADSYTYGTIYKIITYRPSKTGSYVVDTEVASASASITFTTGATFLPQPVIIPPPLEILPDMITVPADSPTTFRTAYTTLNSFASETKATIDLVRAFVTANKITSLTADRTTWALGKFFKWGKETSGAIIYEVSLAIQYSGKIVYIYPETAIDVTAIGRTSARFGRTYIRVTFRKTGGTAAAPTIVVSSVEQIPSNTATSLTDIVSANQGSNYTTSAAQTSIGPAPLKADYDAVRLYSATDTALLAAVRTHLQSVDLTKRVGKFFKSALKKTTTDGTDSTLYYYASYGELDANGFYTSFFKESPEGQQAILKITFKRANGATAPPIISSIQRITAPTGKTVIDGLTADNGRTAVSFTTITDPAPTVLQSTQANITRFDKIEFGISALQQTTTLRLELSRFQLYKNGLPLDPTTYSVTARDAVVVPNTTNATVYSQLIGGAFNVNYPFILTIQPVSPTLLLDADAYSFTGGPNIDYFPAAWGIIGYGNSKTVTEPYQRILAGIFIGGDPNPKQQAMRFGAITPVTLARSSVSAFYTYPVSLFNVIQGMTDYNEVLNLSTGQHSQDAIVSDTTLEGVQTLDPPIEDEPTRQANPLRYLRFQPTALADPSRKGIRLGKIAFFAADDKLAPMRGASVVTLNGTDRQFDYGAMPTAPAVLDYHSLESEWMDSGLGTLLIALPAPQQLSAFALLTGSDPGAAPSCWRLEGSADGETWIPLHTQADPATLPTTPFSQSLVYSFDGRQAPRRGYALFEQSLAAAGKRCDDPTLLETVHYEMATDAQPRLFNPVAAAPAKSSGAMCEYRQADDTTVRVAFQTDLTGASRVKALEIVGTPRQRATSWEEEDFQAGWRASPSPTRGLVALPRIQSPLEERGFGRVASATQEISSLQEVFTLPLKQADGFVDVYSQPLTQRQDVGTTVKYVRFRSTKTRGGSPAFTLGSFALWARPGQQLELRRAKASNPMGKWAGTVEDLAESNPAARGFKDSAGTPLVIAFPEPVPVAGFSWKTPAATGTESTDPVRWKLEGSANGTYWFTLHEQTRDYGTPMERGWRVPLFWFDGKPPLFR